MEVLHGNQSGSKHSRRLSDKISSGENRTLSWSLEESDIALFPHSPLALADVLSRQGGYLDLIPASSNPANKESGQQDLSVSDSGVNPNLHPETGDRPAQPDVEETPAKHGTRPARDRFNLLTLHSPTELMQQCKRILVENALVKNKGDRQLYLAAGFISWTDTANSGQRQKAPLLLYPTLLVRVADQQRYEIRLSGDIPEYNEALLIHLEQLHSVTLPPFDETAPLVDFFARVAECLRDATALQLEFDVALGSASLVHDQGNNSVLDLPDVPSNFDVGLAMSITGNKSLHQLSAVLRLIPDFNLQAAPSETDIDATGNAGIAGLRKYAAKLAAEGLDHIEFRQLPSMPAMIHKWSKSVGTAMATPSVVQVLQTDDLSARELVKLSGIIELIDKAPASVEQLGHPDLCYANTTVLLRRAQHQAKLIEDELNALQEYFLLDKIPPKQQLLSLISILGESADQEPDLVDAGYFNARRLFMDFSKQKPNVLTNEHRRSLSQLAKVLRFRELFVNNAEYRTALGPGYKGLRTDWNQLNLISDYTRELSEVLGSETIAAKIIANWTMFRSQYAIDLETLQNAAEATRRILGVVGSRWQSQTVPALLNHSRMIARRLEQWRDKHGTVDSHADKTAAVVLASFSGESLDHVLVESQVDETHTRIYQQLNAGEISREQISDTLRWLQEASSAAAQQDLDIDAIVEHLQIA